MRTSKNTCTYAHLRIHMRVRDCVILCVCVLHAHVRTCVCVCARETPMCPESKLGYLIKRKNWSPLLFTPHTPSRYVICFPMSHSRETTALMLSTGSPTMGGIALPDAPQVLTLEAHQLIRMEDPQIRQTKRSCVKSTPRVQCGLPCVFRSVVGA